MNTQQRPEASDGWRDPFEAAARRIVAASGIAEVVTVLTEDQPGIVVVQVRIEGDGWRDAVRGVARELAQETATGEIAIWMTQMAPRSGGAPLTLFAAVPASTLDRQGTGHLALRAATYLRAHEEKQQPPPRSPGNGAGISARPWPASTPVHCLRSFLEPRVVAHLAQDPCAALVALDDTEFPCVVVLRPTQPLASWQTPVERLVAAMHPPDQGLRVRLYSRVLEVPFAEGSRFALACSAVPEGLDSPELRARVAQRLLACLEQALR
ncbi:hypothetical protein [Chondromyces crocatus]|uniref:Uncharacterized protein n=1 Tax=Chondromyces crocatus TaxID=52 RepID=A0A0K1ES88_CHOCO|nr:hypothetical protein [Chondromyces crocatus]AKT43795.1 uncharacterized protein CMC5_080320 [Chondromyces crocatus]